LPRCLAALDRYEELLWGGDAVVVYDSLYKGHREAVVKGAAFVKGDLLDTATLRDTLKQHRVEAVVHMAADSLVGESVKEPAKYFRIRDCFERDADIGVGAEACAAWRRRESNPQQGESKTPSRSRCYRLTS